MGLIAKQIRLQFQEFDRKMLSLHTENSRLTNAQLAEIFGCGYGEIVRSLRRSGIKRKVGKPKQITVN
jgi:hypothetical protein